MVNYIYTITNPKTNHVVYVGKTINPKERFGKHLSYKRDTKISRWIKEIKTQGVTPVFDIIDQTEGDWKALEKHYILMYKSTIPDLLNVLPGGEGGNTFGGRKHLQSSKDKIGKSNSSKKHPELSDYNKKIKGISVIQTDMQGNEICRYESFNDAGRGINRSSSRIRKMVLGLATVNHVGGYKFIRG